MNTSQSLVQLRDVIETDLPIFFEQQLDPDATQMAAFSSREREAFTLHWAKILADVTVVKQTVLFDGQIAGNIVSWEQSGQREVGYWLGKAYWGKGIATRALAQFLDQVKVRPLYAYVARHNLASRRVLEKCGFILCSEDDSSTRASGDQIEELVLKIEADARSLSLSYLRSA